MRLRLSPVVAGILAGLGILVFYLGVLALFESYGFALSEFARLWKWLLPLAAGFGTQIGLYTSMRHDPVLNSGVATSGTVSGGSMVLCCSHFILNALPLAGLAGLSLFLMAYQKFFFGIGIVSSIVGIILMLNHNRKVKRGLC